MTNKIVYLEQWQDDEDSIDMLTELEDAAEGSVVYKIDLVRMTIERGTVKHPQKPNSEFVS